LHMMDRSVLAMSPGLLPAPDERVSVFALRL
jgi:hypothetical protein